MPHDCCNQAPPERFSKRALSVVIELTFAVMLLSLTAITVSAAYEFVSGVIKDSTAKPAECP